MTQNKRFKMIHEILEKSKERSKYDYYYGDRYATGMPPRCGKSVFQQGLNCSDEIVPRSNERRSKINALMHEKVLLGSPDFMDKWGSIVFKMHNLMKEEFMALTGCSEREADYWVEANVNFNHVKEHVATDGKRYLSVDPKIGNKYVGFIASLKESESND